MADWYVSSVAYAAIPQFAASHAYSVGDFVRPLTAQPIGAQYAYRVTTAGTSSTEPSWNGAYSDNNTITSGGATFTNVTARSTYGWSAAAGNLYCLTNAGSQGATRTAIGDRVFLSSDHSETNTATNAIYNATGSGFGTVQFISVNRAGSVPPVAADVLSGAAIIAATGSYLMFDAYCNQYWQGITFTLGGALSVLYFNSGGYKTNYFKNCAIVLTTSSTTATIEPGNIGVTVLDNTTVTFNAAGQRFGLGSSGTLGEFKWMNTPAATLGTVPTTLFTANPAPIMATCRGVDLSAITTTLYFGGGNIPGKLLFDSCRIASGVVRLGTTGYNNTVDEIELVNCYDGTSFIAERHTPAGDVTTEFTITLTGGAQDNVGAYSHKMVSSSRADPYAMMLEGFWMDFNLSTTSSARTATVEIVSSASLNNNDISLLIEYQGSLGSSLATFANSFPNPLATVTAVPASTAAWNSLPSTPVKQHLQVSFTPMVTGRVRAQVRLGKPSTTVWVNPQVAIT